MNQELLTTYFTHVYKKPITDANRDHFLQCIYLLFKTDICKTCSTIQNTYYDKLDAWFKSQIGKGMNPNDYDKNYKAPVIESPKVENKPDLKEFILIPKTEEEIKADQKKKPKAVKKDKK